MDRPLQPDRIRRGVGRIGPAHADRGDLPRRASSWWSSCRPGAPRSFRSSRSRSRWWRPSSCSCCWAIRSTRCRCSRSCWRSASSSMTPSSWSRTSNGTSAQGLSPKEAAYKTMEEVSGALIAIGLVLLAVFVPAAFVPGIPGVFFRQFAVDDRDGRRGVAARLADPVAGHGRHAAEAARRHDETEARAGIFAPLLRLGGDKFNEGFDWLSDRYGRLTGAAGPHVDDHAGRLCRPARPDRLAHDRHADRLHSGPGPGLPDRRHPAAAGRLAGAYRRGHDTRRSAARADRRRAGRGGLRRHGRRELLHRLQRRRHVHPPQAVGRARRQR